MMALSLAEHEWGWEEQICGKGMEITELAELRCLEDTQVEVYGRWSDA